MSTRSAPMYDEARRRAASLGCVMPNTLMKPDTNESSSRIGLMVRPWWRGIRRIHYPANRIESTYGLQLNQANGLPRHGLQTTLEVEANEEPPHVCPASSQEIAKMATATVTPSVEVVNAEVVNAEVVNAPASTAPVVLTSAAIAKVKEIMATQDPVPAGLRIGVVGGGCSGFQYSMSFENASGMMDKIVRFEDLKVFVDATSAMYLNGCTVDYVETLEAAGFKFENPQVKSTCGCGSSFSV